MQEPVAPELPRTWEQLRAAMFDNLRSAECNEVGAWSMDVLAGAFGEKWPALAADRNADLLHATVYGASTHFIAYAQIVELALRLRIFEDHVGIAAVRNQLRRDLRFEAWHHARLQLEVAALAVACGHSISLEPRLEGNRPPGTFRWQWARVISFESRRSRSSSTSKCGPTWTTTMRSDRA